MIRQYEYRFFLQISSWKYKSSYGAQVEFFDKKMSKISLHCPFKKRFDIFSWTQEKSIYWLDRILFYNGLQIDTCLSGFTVSEALLRFFYWNGIVQ